MGLDQLIERCKSNDAEAQSQLYKQYASKLFSLCLKYSRNYVEAQDHLQDAFVSIFKKINQYKHKGSFEGWMKRVVINTALQSYRRAGIFDIIRDDNIEDEETVDLDSDDVDLSYLLKIIQELPNRYRLVFNLYVLDGYSHNQISKMLEISVGTSKSNLARARLILKQKVENYMAKVSSETF